MTTGWLKKISSVLAVGMLITCLAGCGGDTSSADEGTTETGEVETAEVEETVKIGYIFKGDCDKDGLVAQMNADRLAACAYTDVQTCYIENVSTADFPEAVRKLVAAGCTYIVSTSSRYVNVLNDVAGKNMDLNFVSYGAKTRTVNVAAYTDHIYEGAYVAGMAAAYNSESEKIGIVVDPELLYNTPVINAAALGTQLVYADAQLITAFASADHEIRSAVDALSAKGCDVIISYTESKETVKYCDSKNIKVIGNVDFGAEAENYDDLMFSYYVDHNSYYLAQFKQMDLDTWEPLERVGNLANGGVNISAVRDSAKEGTQDIIDALVPKLSSGEADIFKGELKNTDGNVMLQLTKVMEPNEIYGMTWYVLGVDTSAGVFVEQKDELEINPFDIIWQ